MSSFPWLTTIGLIPLVGALVVAFLPASVADKAKHLAVGFSVVTLLFDHRRGAAVRHRLRRAVPARGAARLDPAVRGELRPRRRRHRAGARSRCRPCSCRCACWPPGTTCPRSAARQQNYFALMLVLETFMVGVFAATDVFLFYVFFEAMLVPVYFLIGSYGGAQRQYAAVKFLLFSLPGGLVMLVAVIALYFQGPGGSRGLPVHQADRPEHRTRPPSGCCSSASSSRSRSRPRCGRCTPGCRTPRPRPRRPRRCCSIGVLDKVGTFGMIRFCLPLFPDAAKWATPVVLVLAVVSILYGALLAIGQTDIMRLIALHLGQPLRLHRAGHLRDDLRGAVRLDAVHGQPRLLHRGAVPRRGDADPAPRRKRIADFGGWQRVTPLLAGVFLLAGLSALSLPGLSTFISEFLVLVGHVPALPRRRGGRRPSGSSSPRCTSC